MFVHSVRASLKFFDPCEATKVTQLDYLRVPQVRIQILPSATASNFPPPPQGRKDEDYVLVSG